MHMQHSHGCLSLRPESNKNLEMSSIVCLTLLKKETAQ